MGKPKAPAPPDPRQVAAAQTSQNVNTAIAQQFLNNTNQVTPFGNLTYTQDGTYQMVDPNSGQVYDIPLFTATQTFSPEQQAILDQMQGANLNLAELANERSGFLGDYLGQEFSYDPSQHMDWAMGLYDNLSERDNARQMEQLGSTLAQQGLMPGSEAYDRAMGQMMEARNRSRDRFALDSYGQGFGTAMAERNQPINEISALLSGSQLQTPNFVNTTPAQMANVDRAGLEMDSYGQQMAAYNAQMQQRQNMMGGLFGLASSFIPMISDARLKTDVERVGETGGLPVYDFRYLWDAPETRRRGFMAQDVAKVKPEAVIDMGGVMALDYAQLPEVPHA